jgi:hypothetical protein
MGDAPTNICPKCDGREWIIYDDLHEDPCTCLQARMLREHLEKLGPDIAMAPRRHSPLFNGVPGEDAIDRTTENLFIHGHWQNLCVHLRWALSAKLLKLLKAKQKHRVRIITDESLVDIWLGRSDYARRPKSEREDGTSVNTLSEYVGSHDLLILRFGFLGYPNKALPGIIKQALGIREVQLKPTWLIDSPTNEFETTLAYSSDLARYIQEHYESVRFDEEVLEPDPVRGPTVVSSSAEADDDSDEVAMGGVPAPPVPKASPPPRRQPMSTEQPRVTPADDLDQPGGSSKGRSQPGSYLRKKGSGGWGGEDI